MSLNKSEHETFRLLRRVPLEKMLEILYDAKLPNGILEYRTGKMKPTLEAWRMLRVHGWNSREFTEAVNGLRD